MPTDQSVEYINSIKYQKWQSKLKDIISAMSDQQSKALAHRRLRYAEIDIEQEKRTGRLSPDELYIPQHIIDSNIRREQASYVQYVTQSNRAVILKNRDDATVVSELIEQDVTQKIRYDGWQLSMYAAIDAMQQNGYAMMEVVFDQEKPGAVQHEYIEYGDFGFVMDTRDLQQTELLTRAYLFSKTKLIEMCNNGYQFKREEIDKVIETDNTMSSSTDAIVDKKDKSLYKIYKVMFRVNGVVFAAWASDDKANDWLRDPRPLFLGRQELNPLTGQLENMPEYDYPYYLFPYLISENNTIANLKGRVFLDQDCQEAVSSLLSSYVTAHRRASGLYFSKDTDDPNTDEDLLMKNVNFKTGALINARIKQFQLNAPGADSLSAIEGLRSANLQETSQTNFAAMNRKDSRKTATEVSASAQASQSLTTVQVVLFSSALRAMYQRMFGIIQTRVNTNLIQVKDYLKPLYAMSWIVKPSGDVDVIERQQVVQAMMNAWPVMQNTPAAQAFLSDLLLKMFPENAQRYIQIFEQQIQQQQQQAQSSQAQVMQYAQQLGMSVVELSKHPEFFSDMGKQQALPVVKQAAAQIMEMQKQTQQPKQ